MENNDRAFEEQLEKLKKINELSHSKNLRCGYVYFIFEYPVQLLKEFIGDKDVKLELEKNPAHLVDVFKIGETIDVVKRLKQLQTGNMRPLKYYKTIKCNNKKDAQNLENRLHQIYRSKRIFGEWFQISTTEIDAICANFDFIQLNAQMEVQDVHIQNNHIQNTDQQNLRGLPFLPVEQPENNNSYEESSKNTTPGNSNN